MFDHPTPAMEGQELKAIGPSAYEEINRRQTLDDLDREYLARLGKKAVLKVRLSI